MAEAILFRLQIDDADLTLKIEQLRARIKELNRELKSNPGPERARELAKELGEAKRGVAELQKQQRSLNREFAALSTPKDSIAGLRIEYARLSEQIAKLTAAERQSDFGRQLIKQAAGVKRQIDDIEQSIGRFTGNVGNYKSALSGLFQALNLLGVGIGLKEFISLNTQVDDALAAVGKTTDLTRQELEALRNELSARDTRTSIFDQLKIAQIGGQLGVAKEQVAAFTASVDVLNVALGDAFGNNVEELTRVLAGLRNSLGETFKTDDVANDILRLGNAFNELEKQGSATAPVIAEFSNRLSGSLVPLGVTTDEIIGLSTALAELNITPERGATAVSTLIFQIAQDAEKFGKAIGLSGKELDAFVARTNTDLVGSLQQVAVAVSNNQDAARNFAQVVKEDLGVSRQSAVEVLGKLGNASELLTTRIQQSAEALRSTSSVYAEFEVQNNTSAAALDKLVNAVQRLLISDEVQAAIRGVAGVLTDLVELINTLVSAISSNTSEFLSLGAAAFAFSRPGRVAAETITQTAAAMRTATVATTAQTVATQASTIATRALAAAQAALPLLAIIAGIYALTKAIDIYNSSLSASEKANRAVADAQRSIAESTADELVALEKSIGVLQSAASSQEQRKKAIEELTRKYPEYLQGVNLEIQNTQQLTAIQERLRQVIIRTAAARAKEAAQAQVAGEIVEKQLRLEEARRDLAEREATGRTFTLLEGNRGARLRREIRSLESDIAELNEELRLTGEKFDQAFSLDKPLDLGVIDIVDPKSLKRKERDIEQAGRSIEALSEKEKKALEKRNKQAADAANKRAALEASQAKRIEDIRKRLVDLSIDSEGKYDRELQALERERLSREAKVAERIEALRKSIAERTGKAVVATTTAEIRKLPDALPADITEADLIDQEAQAAAKALERKRELLLRERERERKAQEEKVRALSLEVAKVEAATEQAAAEEALQGVRAAFDKRRQEVERFYGEQELLVRERKARREITEQEAASELITISKRKATELQLIEEQFAARVIELVNSVKETRVAAAQAERAAALEAIRQREAADIAAAEKEAVDLGVDASAQVAEIRKRAAAEAADAERQFAEQVKAATNDASEAQLAAIQSVDDARVAVHDAELARIEEESRRRREGIEQAISLSQQVASKLLELESANIERRKSEQLAAIDEEGKRRIAAAKGNQKKIERIEKEIAARKEAVEKQAAEKRKQIAIIEATINTAVAVAKVAYNPVLAAITAALGALQIAIISAQKFARGGRVGDGQSGVVDKSLYVRLPDFSSGGRTGFGLPLRDETGERIAGKIDGARAVVHAGEYVAPRWMTAAAPAIFDEIERARLQRRAPRLRPFAEGGFARPYVVRLMQSGGFPQQPPPVAAAQSLQQQRVEVSAAAEFTDEQIEAIARMIATAVGHEARVALAEGLNDADRRLERRDALEKRQKV